jgi:hypothetical protein
MEDLKSKNVFIDTSIYVKENFQYSSEKLDTLKKYALEGKIKLFTHKIIVDEVKSNIVEEISKAISSIKKIKKEGKIFRNLPKEKIFSVFDKHDLIYYKNLLFKQLDDFISSSKSNFIPHEYNVDLIFQDYFTNKPPFSEGKKKAEFPDAFVLSAIEDWCKKNDEKIYLLSQDDDWLGYVNKSDYMFIISSVEELLNKITFQYEKLSRNAVELIEKNIKGIEEGIKSKFLEFDFITEYVDGDVEDIDIEKIEIIDKYIISLISESSLTDLHAHFEIVASVSFSANVHYGDESTASYDSEEKRLYIWEYIDKKIEQTEEISIDLRFSFNTNYDMIDIEYIRITDPKDIWVSVEDDKYPYK